MKKFKSFRFTPTTQDKYERLDPPSPTKNYVPNWWKISEQFINKEQTLPGLKACIPFLDAFLSGYVVTTPFELFVGRNEDNDINIRWNAPSDFWARIVGERPKELGANIPRPAGHDPTGFIWGCTWGWKTPRGYSTLVTHPLNRFDLPFTTLSAIMDSDKFVANGNIPFFIKEGFSGVIPKGTPIAQLIPIKRATWVGRVDESLYYTSMDQAKRLRNPDGTDSEGSYKKSYWTKKDYS